MISLEDFPTFFEELWGHPPFPWQTRLMTEVAGGCWPSTLDLPTGSGKTAVLEIACFALALDACNEPENRRQHRRIALIIDRRIVVDQAYQRAKAICDKLEKASSGVLEKVAEALNQLHSGQGSKSPITVAALRGGTVRDNNWARSPDQPCFLISTVDQIGSRLLFRGYGVSDGMAPIHAGLLGIDCLYFLDEVHLSRPFAQTLDRIFEYGSIAELTDALVRRPSLVSMSATPGQVRSAFRLDDEDLNHPILRKRLATSKPAKLVTPIATVASRSDSNEKVAQACVKEALKYIENGAKATAIIVNRVDTARVAAKIAGQKLDRVVLLTGRMRPLDRDSIQNGISDFVQAGRDRENAQAVLVVSTQAIEAGADYDFDAIVTECASLDALRQRFGRLDRRGELGGSSESSIVVGDRDVEEGAQDPIYGEAIGHCWRWLSENAAGSQVDMGILAQDQLGEPPEATLALRKKAPELLPAYLDLWAQTAPKPAVEPDLTPFLHGADRGAPQVQVLWRGDLQTALLRSALDRENAPRAKRARELIRSILEVCPPSALECISLPIWAARSWLLEKGQSTKKNAEKKVKDVLSSLCDLEGASAEEQPGEEETAGTPFLIYGPDETRASEALGEIVAGSTLILPASCGGLNSETKNWDPDAIEEVDDLGDLAQLLHRGRAMVRWSGSAGDSGPWKISDPEEDDIEERGEQAFKEAFVDWESQISGDDRIEAWRRFAANWIVSSSSWNVIDVDLNGFLSAEQVEVDPGQRGERWRASISSQRIPGDELRKIRAYGWGATEAVLSGPEVSSFTCVEVALEEHLRGVEGIAAEFAEHLALPACLKSDVALAGLLHDLGKSDPRFQVMLRGGDHIDAAHSTTLLAKSALPYFNRARRQHAQELAGYPKGARHELMSVALVQPSSSLRSRANDWDLVLHLVASHHGHCRPFAPVLASDSGVDVRLDFEGEQLEAMSNHGLDALDSGVSGRFWSLSRRYGWHGLAFLEAVLRLADHRRSEVEQLGEEARA